MSGLHQSASGQADTDRWPRAAGVADGGHRLGLQLTSQGGGRGAGGGVWGGVGGLLVDR